MSDPARNENNAMDATTITELREACAGLARPGGSANFVRMFKPRFAELVAKRLLGATDVGPLPTPAPRGFLGRSRARGMLGNLARRARA